MMIALRRISTTCWPRGPPLPAPPSRTTAGVRATLSAMRALHHRRLSTITKWLTILDAEPSLATVGEDHQRPYRAGAHADARASRLARRDAIVRFRAARGDPHRRG